MADATTIETFNHLLTLMVLDYDVHQLLLRLQSELERANGVENALHHGFGAVRTSKIRIYGFQSYSSLSLRSLEGSGSSCNPNIFSSPADSCNYFSQCTTWKMRAIVLPDRLGRQTETDRQPKTRRVVSPCLKGTKEVAAKAKGKTFLFLSYWLRM